MRKHLYHIIFFVGIVGPLVAQQEQWMLNPKVLNDTIEGHIFPRDNKLFVSDVLDQHMDINGFLWTAHRNLGLQKLSVEKKTTYYKGKPEHSQFPFSSSHFVKEINGEIYIGAARGFCKYNYVKDSFELYGQKDLAQLSAYKSSVHAMEFVSEDTLLIGNKWGLLLFDLKNDKIIKTLWQEEPQVDGGSSYHFVRKIIKDPTNKNLFWVVGRQGLFSIDKRNWERTYYGYEDDIPQGSLMDYMNDLIKVGDDIYVLYCGDQRKIELNGNEIIKYNLKTGKWKKILNHTYTSPATNEKLHSWLNSFQRYGDYILVCSRGFGPQLINTKTDEVVQVFVSHPKFKEKTVWSDENRLVASYLTDVYSAAVDRNGYLWAIHKRDNFLKTNESIFIKKEELDLGEINIHNIYVNGAKYTPSKYAENDDLKSYTLNQRERDFAFSFSLINSSVDSMIYEYQLDNNEWKKPLNNYLAQLNSLSGGKHEVKIRARKGDVTYDEQVIKIHALKRTHEKLWFIFSILAFLGLIGYLFYKSKINNIRNEERLKSNFQKQMAGIEMQALRAQMNPHFLFNSLNSIKHYVVTKPVEETAEYVTTFSMLIRQILQNSNDKIITLTQELKAIKLYVEVEQKRFEKQFDFICNIDENINTDIVFIPPLLIQPYIENSIWHGLMHRKETGVLKLDILLENEILICTVEDNGVGRKVATEIKKRKEKYKKKSLGMAITSDRIKLIEQIYGVTTAVEIVDMIDDNDQSLGTKIVIKIPKILKETIDSF